MLGLAYINTDKGEMADRFIFILKSISISIGKYLLYRIAFAVFLFFLSKYWIRTDFRKKIIDYTLRSVIVISTIRIIDLTARGLEKHDVLMILAACSLLGVLVGAYNGRKRYLLFQAEK